MSLDSAAHVSSSHAVMQQDSRQTPRTMSQESRPPPTAGSWPPSPQRQLSTGMVGVPQVSRRYSVISTVSSVEPPVVTENATSTVGFTRMDRNKKFTIITFCIANFCVGAFYSILGPFFPQEAAKKGVNSTLTGFIFGSFELVMFIMSPIFGNFIGQIGGKFMYCTGVMVCGSSAILFGFLDRCPPGTIYVVMCFIVRCAEALGAAAFSTASFSILANTFPENVATVFGTLELFSGLGMMVGPPLGGFLYQLGGFLMPFVALGSLLVVVGVVSTIILPSQQQGGVNKAGGILSLLKIPVVVLVCYVLMAGAISIGFLDVALSIQLETQHNLTPVILGLVFLSASGAYALSAPLWGYLSDKFPHGSVWLIAAGFTFGGIAFWLVGPAPFLPLPTDSLALVIVGLILYGLGVGTLVASFQVLTTAARDHGHPDSLETFGLVSGLFNGFFSLGAFIGPLGGGWLNDTIQFPWTCVAIAGVLFLGPVMLVLFMLIKMCIKPAPPPPDTFTDGEDTETAPLLSGSHRQTSYVSA